MTPDPEDPCLDHPPASIVAACDLVDCRLWGDGSPDAPGVHDLARRRARRLGAMLEFCSMGVAASGRVLGWPHSYSTYNSKSTWSRLPSYDREAYLHAVYDELEKLKAAT